MSLQGRDDSEAAGQNGSLSLQAANGSESSSARLYLVLAERHSGHSSSDAGLMSKPQSHRSITRVAAFRTAIVGTAMAGKDTARCLRSLPVSWPHDQGDCVDLRVANCCLVHGARQGANMASLKSTVLMS